MSKKGKSASKKVDKKSKSAANSKSASNSRSGSSSSSSSASGASGTSGASVGASQSCQKQSSKSANPVSAKGSSTSSSRSASSCSKNGSGASVGSRKSSQVGKSKSRGGSSTSARASSADKPRPSSRQPSKSMTKVESAKQGESGAASTGAGGGQSEKAAESSVANVFQSDPKLMALFRHKKYQPIKMIGSGSFGQVFKGLKVDTNEEVAIKVIMLTALSEDMRSKYLPREMCALINIHHPNVVRTYDIIRADQKLFIVMEFAANDALSSYLLKVRKGPAPEPLSQYWIHQVITALAYVHAKHRMAHRDIKLQNVLLDAKYETKLADFGMTKECWDKTRHCTSLSNTICGTLPYFSPQLMGRQPYNAFMADVWAIGVSLYAMMHLSMPFDCAQPKEALTQMFNYPAHVKSRINSSAVSASATDVIVRLLDPDEKRRMTLHESLGHKWLAKRLDKKVAFGGSIKE